MLSVWKSSFVYILYVPRREEANPLSSPGFKKLLASVADSKVDAVFSMLDHGRVDREIEQGCRLERVFFRTHGQTLGSMERIWVAGGGSGAFAREVIRAALSGKYDIPVNDYTPSGSCLGPYIRMLRRHGIRRGYLRKEGTGLMIPRG